MKIFHYCKVAFYTGQANKKYFQKFGLNDDQLVYAPHAVDMDFYKVDTAAGELIRRQLKIKDDEIVFLFAGKLETKKNPGLLIGLFKELDIPTAHLIIAGSGKLEAALKIQAKGIKNIHFLPFQNQSAMPGLYSAADVYLLPSTGPNETWGLAANEAMACGTAVILSNKCGGAYDLVKQGVNGYMPEPGDQDEWLSKIKYLANNKEMVRAFGIESKKIIQEFSYSKFKHALEKEIEQYV